MVWDAGTDAQRGLGILVSPTGTRSYRVVYYFPGSPKPHSMHLGRVGEITLAEARKRALELRKNSREGVDPKGDDVSKSTDFKSASRSTCAIGKSASAATRPPSRIQRVVLRACADWLHRPVATIRVQEIDKLLNTIRDGDGNGAKPRPYLANKVHALLRTFFAWCAKPDDRQDQVVADDRH